MTDSENDNNTFILNDTEQFTKEERSRIADCLKPHRFDSEDMYELYEKVSAWYSKAGTNRNTIVEE